MRLFTIMSTAFSNFDDTVRNYLQKTFNDLGLNYTQNQIFGVIFDGVKGIMQNLMFYIEDAFTEQNIYTAKRKKSIYSLAKISGYEPFYGSAASGTVYCKLANNISLNSSASKVYIQNKTTIINKNTNLIYTVLLPTNYYTIDLSKPLQTHEFKIVQGTFKVANYIASGNSLDTINITGTGNFDKEYVTVKVNGEAWTEVSNLYEMSENEKAFIITTGYDNTLNILFGNEIHGMIPETGSTITVEYLNHIGLAGNIKQFDTYKLNFFADGTDNTGSVINLNDFCILSVNNMISGGTDADTVDFVKNMIGYNSRSNVLASEENFKLFLKRFSFISDCKIYSSEHNSSILISALSNYYTYSKNPDNYFTTPLEKMNLTEYQKEMITTSLNNSNKSMAGVTVKFEDPIIRRFAMVCYIKSDNIFNKLEISTQINTLLAKFFIDLNTNNKEFIAKSEIIKYVLDNLSDIDAFDFNFISELAEETFYKGYYDKRLFNYGEGGYSSGYERVFYSEDKTPGLDDFGNISLDTPLEFPLLRGGFRYYPDKTDKQSSVIVEPIQIFFI